MQVITLLNEKGGVGKTTLAVHIAAGLALAGKRVLLIDADAQGNATLATGYEPSPGLYQLLVRNAAFRDVVQVVPGERYSLPDAPSQGVLGLIPSNLETRNIANSIPDVMAVHKRMSELHGAIDYVVIDTSPTPSLLHGAIFMATDYIIIPTLMEFLGINGMVQSIEHASMFIENKKTLQMPPLRVMGIAPTMVRMNTIEHSENIAELQSTYGDMVWEPITHRIAWGEAMNRQQPVWVVDPGGKAAAEAQKLVQRVLMGLGIRG